MDLYSTPKIIVQTGKSQ